ncbi:hypothetical protein INR49_007596 [Caranx melampygus]|nr:hypothetical protein INR49_007596 [Caranx melampygus]
MPTTRLMPRLPRRAISVLSPWPFLASFLDLMEAQMPIPRTSRTERLPGCLLDDTAHPSALLLLLLLHELSHGRSALKAPVEARGTATQPTPDTRQVSGSLMFSVSGSSRATRPDTMATEEMMI